MKVLGRIVAAVIAGIITVLMVQQVIRRVYLDFGKKYITLPAGADDGPETGE